MALTTSERALLDPIASRHDAIVAELAHVVGIPTGTGHHTGLDACRAWFRAKLESLGATCSEIAGTPAPAWLREGDRGTKEHEHASRIPPVLVAHRNHPSPKLRLLLCGHIDTVHDPLGSFNKLTIAPDGKKATGPGCADMKGGLLVALEALAAITRAGLPVSWTFAMNSDEESGSFQSDKALREVAGRGFDYGLVFEPAMPDGGLVVERPASSQFMIECRGKAAHVGRDFTSGISAVTALAHAVLEASKIADPANGLIVSVGPLEGGSATNIVPDVARAWGNVRAFSPAAESLAAEKLRELETKSQTLPTTKVHYILSRPAKPQTPAVSHLANIAQACSNDLQAIGRGVAMPFGKTGGVCDGNNLLAVGLPVIDTLGVRGGGLHTTSEWIDLESLTQRAQLTAILISRLIEQTL
ncbi:MAG: M20/M25/M40 family metallo-hydrolase [Phycisphaerales bacterium]